MSRAPRRANSAWRVRIRRGQNASIVVRVRPSSCSTVSTVHADGSHRWRVIRTACAASHRRPPTDGRRHQRQTVLSSARCTKSSTRSVDVKRAVAVNLWTDIPARSVRWGITKTPLPMSGAQPVLLASTWKSQVSSTASCVHLATRVVVRGDSLAPQATVRIAQSDISRKATLSARHARPELTKTSSAKGRVKIVPSVRLATCPPFRNVKTAPLDSSSYSRGRVRAKSVP